MILKDPQDSEKDSQRFSKILRDSQNILNDPQRSSKILNDSEKDSQEVLKDSQRFLKIPSSISLVLIYVRLYILYKWHLVVLPTGRHPA